MISTDQKTSEISIVIPTLNEEGHIPSFVRLLSGQAKEVIVADGGSSDGTTDMARALGFQVVEASAGRAAQLNLGAACARGRILLFAHADTLLPETFHDAIVHILGTQRVIAGAFSLAIADAGPALRFIAHCANIRSRLLQLPYGDQGIFITREHFDRLGGFPDLPIMEDYCFVRKAKAHGRIVTLPLKAITSPRRWQRLGVVRTTVINHLMVAGFTLGVPPSILRSLYRR